MWSEARIIRAIARQTFNRKCVLLVDNCNWTGHECDVLGVTADLRVIDVEVKISRADLKADAKKDKWWHRRPLGLSEVKQGPWGSTYREQLYSNEARQWPPRVWKHYYALPAELWAEALFSALPSPASGVLLLTERRGGVVEVHCERRATPNRDASKLSAAQAIDIARLANLRMWDAYQGVAESNARPAQAEAA